MFEFLTLAVSDLGIMGNLEKYAGNVTLSGLLIVFLMLVLLVFIIAIFGKMMSGFGGKKKEATQKRQPSPVAPAPVAVANDDSDEVVAAISAAVMMMYEGTGKVPVIRSIRPAATGGMSAWRAAGVANNTRSF